MIKRMINNDLNKSATKCVNGMQSYCVCNYSYTLCCIFVRNYCIIISKSEIILDIKSVDCIISCRSNTPHLFENSHIVMSFQVYIE